MTRPRNDEHSTEFGLWLREQPEIRSALGYVATNVDYMWRNYKTGEWMLLEEKRYGGQPRRWQKRSFKILDECAQSDHRYRGFHILIFEATNPEDGRMWLDGQEITRAELLAFLRGFVLPNPDGRFLRDELLNGKEQLEL